jgi:hypothetical protein
MMLCTTLLIRQPKNQSQDYRECEYPKGFRLFILDDLIQNRAENL